ncbi:MAG: glycosyltransferase [PVC group bacterium]|nr:glycosyltransferase [PVC group bacterium]
MKNGPLVSIITPSYNSARFLSEAVASVLNQTYRNWEMLIVDDGSTDDTLLLARRYEEKDKRIKVFALDPSSGGPAIPRNYGMRQAKGSYIAFLDSDDMWFAEKLQKQVDLMEKSKDVFLLYSQCIVEKDGRQCSIKPANPKKGCIFNDLLYGNIIACNTVMIRNNKDDNAYFFDEDKKLVAVEDYAMWLSIASKEQISFIKEPLAVYRIHLGGISSSAFVNFKKSGLVIRRFRHLVSKLTWLKVQINFYMKLGFVGIMVSLIKIKNFIMKNAPDKQKIAALCKLSFIIATVDRDEQLQQCINSIEEAHQFRKDISIEILIIIQNAKKNKNIKIRYPEFTYIYQINDRGLSVSRNFAIEKSTGDYLVFLDDDATVKMDFIDELTKKILAYPKINAFCGKLLDIDQHTPFSVLFKNNSIKKLRRIDYQYFMGSAHVLSRRVIEKIGMYDSRFGVGSACYGGSEETDMFFRLKAQRELVLYLPGLIFYHPIPEMRPENVYDYSYSIGAVFVKNAAKDRLFFFIYFVVACKIILKALIRILQQVILAIFNIQYKKEYKYSFVLKGLLAGIINYIRGKKQTVETLKGKFNSQDGKTRA